MSMPKVKGSICDGNSKNRSKTDFYATPAGFTRELLDREEFNRNVWECAAGDGAIVRVLEEYGYTVKSTDIDSRGSYIEELDFIGSKDKFDGDIITNPPFKHMIEFVDTAMALTARKVAFVGPLSVLNSSKRYHAIWSKYPVSKIYLNGRYQHIRSDRGLIPSQFSHLWFVLDKEHTGPTKFEWLNDVVHKG